MMDMLEGVPDARLRAPHLTSSHNISAHFYTKFTMFFPKPSLELVAKIPPWFATKQFPQRSNIPSKIDIHISVKMKIAENRILVSFHN